MSPAARGAGRPVLVGLAVASLILIWGTTWAVIRVGLEGLPPFTGVAARFAIAGALLLLLGRALGIELERGPLVYRLWGVVTLGTFCLSYGIVYWAEQWIPSGLTSVLFATFPLFVALLAHLWLPAEPLDWREFAGLCVGLAGVAAIFSDDLTLEDDRSLVAAVVMLGSPLAAAAANVLVKRWGGAIHPINLVAVPMLLTALVMGLLAAAAESGRPVRLDARSVGALLYLSVLGSAFTFTVYYWLLQRVAATRLSVIALAMPVVAVATGAVFLDEKLSGMTLLGTFLVLAGVALTVRARARTGLQTEREGLT